MSRLPAKRAILYRRFCEVREGRWRWTEWRPQFEVTDLRLTNANGAAPSTQLKAFVRAFEEEWESQWALRRETKQRPPGSSIKVRVMP